MVEAPDGNPLDTRESTVERNLKRIDKELGRVIPKAQKLPFALLIIASLISIVYPIFLSVTKNSSILEQFHILYAFVPVLPIAILYYFKRQSKEARNDLENEMSRKDLSEPEITRIIDKYSGAVDGLGTALPLLGAAILLGVVALGDADSQFYKSYIQKYFMNLAVPFEVVSILILAAAKLYESVFDELSLCFQQIIDESNIKKETKYHEETIAAIKSIGSGNQISIKSDLSEEEFRKLKELCNLLKETTEGMKDEKVTQNIGNLLKLTGK